MYPNAMIERRDRRLSLSALLACGADRCAEGALYSDRSIVRVCRRMIRAALGAGCRSHRRAGFFAKAGARPTLPCVSARGRSPFGCGLDPVAAATLAACPEGNGVPLFRGSMASNDPDIKIGPRLLLASTAIALIQSHSISFGLPLSLAPKLPVLRLDFVSLLAMLRQCLFGRRIRFPGPNSIAYASRHHVAAQNIFRDHVEIHKSRFDLATFRERITKGLYLENEFAPCLL